MARVHHRKARKDYPDHGIKKGDMYYIVSMKTGPRSSVTKRSLTPFKPSQLTNSPFKSGWYAATEAWEDGDKGAEDMRSVAESVRELGEACNEAFENMPEGLQQGDTGQMLENRYSECERIADEMESYADELEALESVEDPGDFDPSDWAQETSTMDPEDAAEFLAEKEQEHDDNTDEYNTALSTNEAEEERIGDEADSTMGDMPE